MEIIILLITGILFRFYNLANFQYWSDDEQLLWSIMRHILIDKHPSLVTPNAALGISLGPLFHYLLAPWYWLVHLNPQDLSLLGSIFGLASIIIIYKTGKLLGGRKTGFIAGLLYSASFMASLFDRRLWALSPNVFLITLGIYSLIQILKGKQKYIVLLTIPIAFSLNSDPSLAVALLTSIATLLIFRPKIQKKYLAYAACLLIILLSPLFIFEIRHNGQNIKALKQTFLNLHQESQAKEGKNFLILQLENFSRFFYASKTNAADAYFCYCQLDEKRPLLVTTITGGAVVLFLFLTIKEKNKYYLVLFLSILSYLAGIFLFKIFLNTNPSFFYAITISPAIFLIAAILISKTNKYLMGVILCSYLILNIYTLTNSSFKYPLKDKINLVSQTINKIPEKNNFSLYYSGDILFASGGWTSLFIYQGAIPTRGNLSLYWGHVYESYGLYPVPFASKEPTTVVILKESDGTISSTVYDNKKNKFNYKLDLPVLTQPKYFK